MPENSISQVRRGAWCLAIGLLLTGPAALANGNYTHGWVAIDAVRQLPSGDLHTLLNRVDLMPILRNGAMFPDGGYAVNDEYGETSHWEPFHLAYADWIRATFQPPWTDDAARHIAFLMGMSAHGMSDQLYDGMFLPRHRFYDVNGDDAAPYGVDGATDTCFAAIKGTIEPPEPWVPAEELAPLYEPLLGHPVDAETIRLGQGLVTFAIVHANTEASDPTIVAGYLQTFPWACGHQDDPDAPGSPPTHGRAVAAYWKVLWARLHGDTAFDKPLLGTFFTGGAPWSYPLDSSNPDSWVSFAMPRGLAPSTLLPTNIVVTRDGEDTVPIPVNISVHYGLHSHLVNVQPKQDWVQDASYTITISPPLDSWDGMPMQRTYVFGFSTLPQPAGWGDEISTADGPPDEAAEASEEIANPADASGDEGFPADAFEAVSDTGGLADLSGESAAESTDDSVRADTGESAADSAETSGGKGGGGCSMLPDAGSAVPGALLPCLLLLLAAARRVRRRCQLDS